MKKHHNVSHCADNCPKTHSNNEREWECECVCHREILRERFPSIEQLREKLSEKQWRTTGVHKRCIMATCFNEPTYCSIRNDGKMQLFLCRDCAKAVGVI